MDHCNVCGASFSICQALDCNKGGLITAHHNELCDGVVNLVRKAFTSTHVCDDPRINIGSAVRGGRKNSKVTLQSTKMI